MIWLAGQYLSVATKILTEFSSFLVLIQNLDDQKTIFYVNSDKGFFSTLCFQAL